MYGFRLWDGGGGAENDPSVVHTHPKTETSLMTSISNYRGIIPAISCPFTPDHRIDEPALRRLASWLAGHEGVVAVMTNGHTRSEERRVGKECRSRWSPYH